MQDSKDPRWHTRYGKDAEARNGADGDRPGAQRSPRTPGSKDSDGWQQYRRWISKAPAPDRRRSGIDPSLYTWKGYRNWTEQVKRNWNDNSS